MNRGSGVYDSADKDGLARITAGAGVGGAGKAGEVGRAIRGRANATKAGREVMLMARREQPDVDELIRKGGITAGAGEGGAGKAGEVGRQVTRAEALRIARETLERAEQERREVDAELVEELEQLPTAGWQLAVAKERGVSNKPTDFSEANIVLAALDGERGEVERQIGDLSPNEQVALATACQIVVWLVWRVRERARVERNLRDD